MKRIEMGEIALESESWISAEDSTLPALLLPKTPEACHHDKILTPNPKLLARTIAIYHNHDHSSLP